MKLILLYDDDCGICTTYSKIIARLRPKLPILPMHNSKLIEVGTKKLGIETYWQSFHMISNGNWTTESEAITELARVFPLGNVLAKVTNVPPVKYLLLKFLNMMQRRRKIECQIV